MSVGGGAGAGPKVTLPKRPRWMWIQSVSRKPRKRCLPWASVWVSSVPVRRWRRRRTCPGGWWFGGWCRGRRRRSPGPVGGWCGLPARVLPVIVAVVPSLGALPRAPRGVPTHAPEAVRQRAEVERPRGLPGPARALHPPGTRKGRAPWTCEGCPGPAKDNPGPARAALLDPQSCAPGPAKGCTPWTCKGAAPRPSKGQPLDAAQGLRPMERPRPGLGPLGPPTESSGWMPHGTRALGPHARMLRVFPLVPGSHVRPASAAQALVPGWGWCGGIGGRSPVVSYVLSMSMRRV